jgi:hypothetical protein
LGHLLTRSGLTYPEASSKVCHDSFCQLGNSFSLPWVNCYETFRKSVEKIQVSLKSDKNKRKIFRKNVVEKIKTRILCSAIFFKENRVVYEIMWKNIVERDRFQMTTWRMRITR